MQWRTEDGRGGVLFSFMVFFPLPMDREDRKGGQIGVSRQVGLRINRLARGPGRHQTQVWIWGDPTRLLGYSNRSADWVLRWMMWLEVATDHQSKFVDAHLWMHAVVLKLKWAWWVHTLRRRWGKGRENNGGGAVQLREIRTYLSRLNHE